jgi:hypothetical protein
VFPQGYPQLGADHRPFGGVTDWSCHACKQLIIGSLVIVATVAIQAEMFGLMTRRHEPVLTWTRHRFRRMAGTVFISIAMLMVLATMTIEVWLWALVLIVPQVPLRGLEPAVYFALVCFTTLGFGDITLPHRMAAAVGAHRRQWLLDVRLVHRVHGGAHQEEPLRQALQRRHLRLVGANQLFLRMTVVVRR